MEQVCIRFWGKNKNSFLKEQRSVSKIDSKQKAILIAKSASQKKAEDIIVLDMRKVCNFCDFFVICSGDSLRRTRTIAENIEENLKKMNIKPLHVEGKIHSVWILLDYIDVVTHIFYKEKRGFYNLEYLWQEAPRLKWEDAKDTFPKTS